MLVETVLSMLTLRLSQFEIGGIALGSMEAGVTQDNHLFFALANEPLKGVIRDIRRGTRPPHDQSPLIEQETEFATDHPAMVREAFAAHLLGTPAFAHGVDQLDAVGVNDGRAPSERPRRSASSRDGSGRGERAACARGAGETARDSLGSATVKRAVAHAFERMQQPKVTTSLGQRWASGVWGWCAAAHRPHRTTW